MRLKSHILLLCVMVLSSCAEAPERGFTLSDADRKFKELCSEEFHCPLSMTKLSNTIWIYMPMEQPLFDFKNSMTERQKSERYTEKPAIHYLHVKFEDSRFVIDYDIAGSRSYENNLGYQTAYSEKFSEHQQKILSSISRSYFDVADQSSIPDFFVLVLADTINGIAFESIFYYEDLKQAMAMPPAIPQDEYVKRYITKIYGDQRIVGDREGKFLDIKEIAWPEFLAMQIENRINFRYQRSAFAPSDDAEKELVSIVATALGYYDFTAFQNLQLHNVYTGQTMLFNPQQIKMFETK